MTTTAPTGPLAGLRVLEVGHFIAAPFAARLLADLGAEVIKVEPAEGDPVRQWGEKANGRSVWWSMHGRNKFSITLDLKKPRGREILLQLASQCDALIENFRPGQLAKWGLGPADLRGANPKLIIAHISGYGQDGPSRDLPAFGVIGEAVGGLRYLTNRSEANGEPPVRVGVSIGDSIAGLYAAFGVVSALWGRDRTGANSRGLTVDVALTEAVLSFMEGMLPEYGALGRIKQPTGSEIATAAPSNAYLTADGDWILIAANSDPLFRRLAELMRRPDLLAREELRTNLGRVSHRVEVDQAISEWTRTLPAATLLSQLEIAKIPSSKIYTAADCAADPQFLSRGMVQYVDDPHHGRVLQAGVVPQMSDEPGSIRWAGPDVGEHTDFLLEERLGMSPSEIAALRAEGVI